LIRISVVPSPEPRWPLMRLVALQNFISAELAALLGCLLPPWPPLFPADLRGFYSTPAPVLLRVRVHPLMRFTSPTESMTVSFLLDTLAGLVHLPQGFSPHRDISTGNSPNDEHPKPIYGPPSAFLTLSVVSTSLHLVSLFHLTATSGIHFSGVITHCLADSPHRRAVPSCH
jgi:hypothetical protein